MNDINAVEEWLKNKSDSQTSDCNKSDKYGFTPLHYAVKFNRVGIFEKLMKNGRAGIHVNVDL